MCLFPICGCGYTKYAMVSQVNKLKLDLKSRKCNFVSYEGDEFGYKCYDHETSNNIWSRDIVFNEEVIYKYRNKSIDSKQPDFVELQAPSNDVL